MAYFRYKKRFTTGGSGLEVCGVGGFTDQCLFRELIQYQNLLDVQRLKGSGKKGRVKALKGQSTYKTRANSGLIN